MRRQRRSEFAVVESICAAAADERQIMAEDTFEPDGQPCGLLQMKLLVVSVQSFILLINFLLILSYHRLGNKAFAAKDYDEAIKHYTAAIAIDSKNCVYFSNRR